MLIGPHNPRLLVIAPHADDEVLEAGGLIAKASTHGTEVKVLYLTISGYASRANEGHPSTELRTSEVKAAVKSLGISSYAVLFEGEEQHLRLDQVPQAELISFIDREVSSFRPSMAIIPGVDHYHQDHRATARASIAALRSGGGSERPMTPRVLGYGHALSGWGKHGRGFQPDVFCDISQQIEKKIAAFECYASQVCQPPHVRSLENLHNVSAVTGAQIGVPFAEAFECIRWVL
ncbi:MAG: PIG-L deacetylase family protein [Methylococcales bacterium]